MNQSLKTFFGAGVAALALIQPEAARAAVNPGNLPLWFEANQPAQFIAHGHDSEFAITATGAEFMLRQPSGQKATARMAFVGGNAKAKLTGSGELAGKVNRLIGNDPTQWQSGLATFAQVRLENVYPGVNVNYYGNQEQLEYDFSLAAGVKPETIALRFNGAQKILVNAQGDLVITLNGGEIVQHQPIAYQTIAGERRLVDSSYRVLDSHTVTFAIGAYDASQPLVIDPILSFSSYFGGNLGEIAWAVAVNPADNSIYLAGQTLSTQISNGIALTTPTAKQANYGGGSYTGDAFVARFDSTGTNLIYCTYLGGKGEDTASAIAVDNAGHAFVAGTTDSTNFPVQNAVTNGTFNGAHITGSYDGNINAFPGDGFVSELSTNGATLVYSTYLGGNKFDGVHGLAIDPSGDAFVTGYTSSTNFPVTEFAYQTNMVCPNNFYVNANAFVAEIAAGGNQLNYSTFLGGSNFDNGLAIAFKSGNVFVAGFTASTNFPWTNGLATGKYLNGKTNSSAATDAFVTMFSTAGTNLNLVYSTFLGSSNNDVARGIAADSFGNAYVVGWTTSTNFPATNGIAALSSFVHTNTTGVVIATNAFLTQLRWYPITTNAVLGYSQTFGGFGVDLANGVILDSATNIFVVGSASSTNFPVTSVNIFGSLRATNSGGSDVFVTAFKSDFSALLYSTYLGGKADDFGNGIAMDSAGNAYVTGQTLSTDFPVLGTRSTNSPALHPIRVGTDDAFLTKIITTGSDPILSATRSGTNMLVFWSPVGDVTPVTLGLESVTNLLMSKVFTNKFTITNGTTITSVTNISTNFIGTTNWTVVTNPAAVLINSNYTYMFNPTNPMQFYRFHHY